MFEFLLPTALNVLQGDSNRRAQIGQDYVSKMYSPWLGNQQGFQTQTNDGNVLAQGFGNYNAAQDEKARNEEMNSVFMSLLGDDANVRLNDSLIQDKAKEFGQQPINMYDQGPMNLVNGSKNKNLYSKFASLGSALA